MNSQDGRVMQKINKLTLVQELPDRWRGYVVGLWRCECGKFKKLPMVRVRAGHHKSCGCLRTKHGHASHRTRTPEYTAWQAMHSRCRAVRGRDCKNYNQRGIKVCERWNSFSAFLADMGPRPSSQHSIDRKDNDKGYEPNNVRWATAAEQQRNRRNSSIWHIRGLIFESTRDAAIHFGVNPKTIWHWANVSREDCYVINRY